jgi:hypothetical protein
MELGNLESKQKHTWIQARHKQDYGKQNRTKKVIQSFTHISRNNLWVCWRKHHKSTMSNRKPQVFDLVTQEQDWESTCKNPNRKSHNLTPDEENQIKWETAVTEIERS